MYRNIVVAEVIVKISIFVFIAIGSVELAAGLLSGSIALTADAFHTYSDAIISIVVLFGLKISGRTPDGKFHFGYYRAETFSAAISALILIVIGVIILYRSVVGFRTAEELSTPIIAIIVALVAMTSFFTMGLKKRSLARKFNSKSLDVDAFNTLKSGFASLLALLGVFLSFIGFHKMDPIAGVIISGFIFFIAFKTVKEASFILMDACMCEDVLDLIKETAKSIKGVRDAYELKLRNTGPFIMGEMRIDLDGKMIVEEAHAIIIEVERAIKEKIPNLMKLTIQINPVEESFS